MLKDTLVNECVTYVVAMSRTVSKVYCSIQFHISLGATISANTSFVQLPSYGTGCNAALEDCLLLDQILAESIKGTPITLILCNDG